MRITALFLVLLVCLSCSCANKDRPVVNNADFTLIVATSLGYILENERLVIDYYNQPLQILDSYKYPIRGHITIKGNRCIVLPAETNIGKILQGMDIFKPVPLVEISGFIYQGSNANIKITLRATGHVFDLKVKKRSADAFEIINISSYTI
jgi:hypothetical protein